MNKWNFLQYLSPEEQKEWNDKLTDAIIVDAFELMDKELAGSDKKEFEKLLADDAKEEDQLTFLSSHVSLFRKCVLRAALELEHELG